MSNIVYCCAALAEIAGCYAFWMWLRLGHSAWWAVPGVASLMTLAGLLTLVESEAELYSVGWDDTLGSMSVPDKIFTGEAHDLKFQPKNSFPPKSRQNLTFLPFKTSGHAHSQL